jgi:hypothetical protein
VKKWQKLCAKGGLVSPMAKPRYEGHWNIQKIYFEKLIKGVVQLFLFFIQCGHFIA